MSKGNIDFILMTYAMDLSRTKSRNKKSLRRQATTLLIKNTFMVIIMGAGLDNETYERLRKEVEQL